MTTTVQVLQEQLRHLRMTETANELPVLLRNAETKSWTYQEFMQEILMLDRLLHRVEVIQLNENDSYRLKHRFTIFEKESVQN